MKPWMIVLIVVCAVILASAIIHRRVIKSLIKFKFMPKAPKWHIWLPKKLRRS